MSAEADVDLALALVGDLEAGGDYPRRESDRHWNINQHLRIKPVGALGHNGENLCNIAWEIVVVQ